MANQIKVTKLFHSVDRSSYDVVIGHSRILTVVTASATVVSDWLKDVSAGHSTTVIALVAVRDPNTDEMAPLDMLSLAVGYHALLFHLLKRTISPEYNIAARKLSCFFNNSNVVAVGLEARSVSEVLSQEHKIEVRRVYDFRDELAANGFLWRRTNGGAGAGGVVNLQELNLDQTAAAVLGDHVVVVERPAISNKSVTRLASKLIGSLTLDAFLCYMIGVELQKEILAGDSSPS